MDFVRIFSIYNCLYLLIELLSSKEYFSNQTDRDELLHMPSYTPLLFRVAKLTNRIITFSLINLKYTHLSH